MFLTFFRILLLGSLSLGAKTWPGASLDAPFWTTWRYSQILDIFPVALLSNPFQRSKEVVDASIMGPKGSCEASFWHPVASWNAIFCILPFSASSFFFVFWVFLLFPREGRLQYCDCWWWCHPRGPLFCSAFGSIIYKLGLAVSWICNAILTLRSFNIYLFLFAAVASFDSF